MIRKSYSTVQFGDVKTIVFNNKGIQFDYCISIPECYNNKYNESVIKKYLDEKGWIFHQSITFSKTPYKQCRKKIYTRNFTFIRVKMFVSYENMNDILSAYLFNKECINEVISRYFIIQK